MIPDFDEHGNLPEGIHPADETEFLRRFGMSSARRKWLGGRLREILSLVKSTSKLDRIFVWGSFVTAKESPNDIDLLLLMRDNFHMEDVSDYCRLVFDHLRARVTFQADVFWAKASIGPEALAVWLDTYQTARDFRRRGIIELRLT